MEMTLLWRAQAITDALIRLTNDEDKDSKQLRLDLLRDLSETLVAFEKTIKNGRNE